MIQKLIDYIGHKVPIEVKPSETTNSQYINLGNKTIRISDHLPAFPSKKIDIGVIVPETPKSFIISIGYKVFCYTSLKRTGDFLIDYIHFNSSIEDKYSRLSQDIIQKQGKEISELKDLVNKLQTLNVNLSNSNDKVKLKQQSEELTKNKTRLQHQAEELTQNQAKLKRQAGEIARLQQTQSEIKAELKEKNAAIKEAADLIETLTTDPEARPLLYSKQGKKYYLDNFPEDIQDLINEAIKEYYSK